MPPNSALGTAELASLAKHDHLVPARLSFVPDTPVGTATVASNPSFPVASLFVSGTSAGWSAGRKDQTIVVTDSGGSVVRGYYRMRANAAAQYVYVNQMAAGDAGLFTEHNRTASIQAGDKVVILNRYDIAPVKPWSSANLQDFDTAVGSYNATPEVIANVAINGAAGDYLEFTDGSDASISVVISATKQPTSTGSTLTYGWELPTGCSNGSGFTSATFTFDAPPGSYWVHGTVIDSIGGATEVARWIRIHDASAPPLDVLIPDDDTLDREHWRIQVTLKESDASVIPRGARVALWGAPTWGGDDVASANKKFVGYVSSRPFMHSPNYHQTTIEVVSPSVRLDEISSASHQFTYTGTTASWENLASSLHTYQYVMWWILRWRSTFLKTFNYTPLNVSNLSGRSKSISLEPGSVWSQLKALAGALDVNIGTRPDGEIIVKADPSLLNDRSSVITRDTLDNTIYSDIDVEWFEHPRVGFVKAQGHYSDLTADTEIIGEAPDATTVAAGVEEENPQRKLYESLTDAKQRVGKLFAKLASRYGRVRVTISANRDVYVPADMQRVPVVVPAAKSPTGAEITLICIPVSRTRRWLGGKRAMIDLELEVETNGVDGTSRLAPVANSNIYTPGDLTPPPTLPPVVPPVIPVDPPVVTEPGAPDIEPVKFAIYNTETAAYRTYDITEATPTWEDMALPGTVTAVEMVQFDRSAAHNRAAWALGNDGGTSWLASAPDAAGTAVEWTLGAAKASIYTQFETFENHDGTIAMYSPAAVASAETEVSTVTYDTGGYSSYTIIEGTLTTGGNPGNCNNGGSNISETEAVTRIDLGDEYTVTLVAFDYYKGHAAPYNLYRGVRVYDSGDNLLATYIHSFDTGATGWKSIDTGAISQANVRYVEVEVQSSGAPVTLNGRIDNIAVTYSTGIATGDAVVATSTDSAATFMIKTVDVTGGADGAFTGSRYGPITYAGGSAQLKGATSFGGAYSNVGTSLPAQPLCAVIPWFKTSNDAYNNTGPSPDYYLAYSAASGGTALIRVNSAGTTNITPTIGGTAAVGVSDRCIGVWRGTHLIYLATVGATTYAFRSLDAGDSWAGTATLAGAVSVVPRRWGGGGDDWIVAAGTIIYTSDDGGVSWDGHDAQGTSIYAELYS